jgi:predicted DNA-binding protein
MAKGGRCLDLQYREVRVMRNAKTIRQVIRERGRSSLRPWHETLESRMTRKCHVRFGGGRSEQCLPGNSSAAYPTGGPNPATRTRRNTRRRKTPRGWPGKACGSRTTPTRVPAPIASGSGSAKPDARTLRVRSNKMPVHAPPDHTLHNPHASIRLDARLDATTRQKVDDLARHLRRPRAAVLSHIMRWGLRREPGGALDQGASQGPVHHLYLYVDADLYEAVQKAATTAGVNTAPWLRHMVRHISVADFPASWQEEQAEERSHDSRRYGKRFMLRLDDPTWEKLDALSTYFERSAAEIVRQLLAQATPDTLPASWHLRVAERHIEQVRQGRRNADDEG